MCSHVPTWLHAYLYVLYTYVSVNTCECENMSIQCIAYKSPCSQLTGAVLEGPIGEAHLKRRDDRLDVIFSRLNDLVRDETISK